MRSVTRWSARYPYWVVGLWLLASVGSAAFVATHGERAFTTGVVRYDEAESTRAERLLRERFGERPRFDQPNEIVVVQSDRFSVDDAAFRAHVDGLSSKLLELGSNVIAFGTSYYVTGDASLVSADRHATLLPLAIRDPERQVEQVRGVTRSAHAPPHFRVHLVGRASVGRDYKLLAEQDLKAEVRIGLPAAIVVLVLVFSTLVAAAVPVLVAGASIVLTLAFVVLIGQAAPMYFLVTNMIVMMGLAVGIDYSLFVLSRYREEHARGCEPAHALRIAEQTAGRAVVFSGATVVLALLGLLLIPTNVYRSLAAGAILVVVMAVLASFTLLPALITLLGERLQRLAVPVPSIGQVGRHWDPITRAITRRPTLSLLLTAGLLGAAALPTWQMSSGFAGIETLPASMDSRQGFQILQQQFRIGVISTAVIVVDGKIDSPALANAIGRLQTALGADPAFFTAQARLHANPAGTLAMLEVPMAGDAESAGAQAAIARLRSELIPAAFTEVPAQVLVTGSAAGYVDFFRLTERYTSTVFAFVFGLSFMLLALAFRSLVVPIKAILVNLLSVGAAYGLMVLVFQRGVGAQLLGFEQVPHVEAWIPLFIFTILYGLSMDYHVLLLSRIREHYDQTHDNAAAVAYGLRSSGRLITGAALIMVAIFAGFAAGDLVMFQQVGFGLAIAILLDATVVRLIVVPAAMTLLGKHNWYLPRWLDWLPRI